MRTNYDFLSIFQYDAPKGSKAYEIEVETRSRKSMQDKENFTVVHLPTYI